MRVIVVEDNVLFCNYICNFLQKADLDTVRTYRLAQAKKVIGTSVREDDIVLADLRLPDGESTTLLQWMRENGYMHPFIMMTNYEEIHSAVHTMKLGAEDYILKPLVETRLLPVIKKIRTVNEAFTKVIYERKSTPFLRVEPVHSHGSADGYDGTDIGKHRNGKGTPGKKDSQAEPQIRQAVCNGRLRQFVQRAGTFRLFRPCQGGVYRSHRGKGRIFSGSAGRHPVHG